MRELLARVDSAELSAWQAYEQVHGPLGHERADVYVAMIRHTIAQCLSEGTLKPADFLPQWDQDSPEQPQSWQEQMAWLEAFTAAHGGEDLRGHAPEPAHQDRD